MKKPSNKRKPSKKKPEPECDCDLCVANGLAHEMFMILARKTVAPKIAVLANTRLSSIICNTFPEEFQIMAIESIKKFTEVASDMPDELFDSPEVH